MSAMASNTPKVVIVGAGPAGIAAATSLHGAADVTLIDKKDYFEIPYARVRLPVEPSINTKIVIPFQEISKIGKVVQDEVKFVSERAVELSGGQSLPYDYLILATGSIYKGKEWEAPELDVATRKAKHQTYYEELSAAQNVLVIGGGAVGLEVAGEVATDFPEKQVTMVHSGKVLLENYPPRLGSLVLSKLEQLGVKVRLGEKAEQMGSEWKLTGSGEVIPADKVYICTGGTPNTSFLKPNGILNATGHVKVDKHLKVEGHSNWFAIGDITSLEDPRLGRLAADQGNLVAANLKQAISGGSKAAKAWKKNNGLDIIILSVGRKAGAMSAFGWSFGGFIPYWLKSKDLLTSMIRGQMGLPK